MINTSLNQEAWCKIFEKYDIVKKISQERRWVITAEQIKAFREPRLMTKFDHACHFPQIFQATSISILPITRGTYVLGQFDIFHPLEKLDALCQIPHKISFPYRFETLDFDCISSEMAAINCAYVGGILQDFLGEEITPTISGRMGSGCFDFDIAQRGAQAHHICVDRAQIEIDAGFESKESFILLEAKNHFADDFVIRQLYYPYRRWHAAIKKRIRNVFLVYSNGVFDVREYGFERVGDYNAIRLIQCKKYTICRLHLDVALVRAMWHRACPEAEPVGVPFPQANLFDRVINLCELLFNAEELSKEEVTGNYGFDARQTDYYLNACKYLGWVESGAHGFVLTPKARAAFGQQIPWRRQFFVEQLLNRRVFRDALGFYFDQSREPALAELVQIMRNAQLRGIDSDETLRRRASTVRAWIAWIIAQIERG